MHWPLEFMEAEGAGAAPAPEGDGGTDGGAGEQTPAPAESVEGGEATAAPPAAAEEGGEQKPEQKSIFADLGVEIPKQPAEPEHEKLDPDTEAQLAEYQKLKAENQALRDQVEDKTIIDKVVERLPEESREEAKQQLGFVSPLMKEYVKEATSDLTKQIEELRGAVAENKEIVQDTSYAEGDKYVTAELQKMGELTGTGIHEYPREELVALVQHEFQTGDYPESWNTEKGFIKIATILNARLQEKLKAQQAAQKETKAEAGTQRVTGSRSRLDASDLKGMDRAERRKRIGWR